MFALDTCDPLVASADGTKIWAAQAGRAASEAPALVFVPGFASSSLVFDRQFRDEELLSKYCLITYEPRGQGRSSVVAGAQPWLAARFAEDFVAVCTFYGATRVFLVGWSAGCAAACDLFMSGLEHWVAGFVFLSGMPVLSMFPDVSQPSVPQFYFPLLGDAAGVDADELGRHAGAFVDACLWAPSRARMPYAFRAALVGTLASTPQTVRAASFRQHQQQQQEEEPSARTRAALSGCEAVFVVGREEAIVYPERMVALYQTAFPQVRVVHVAEAGHMVFWEQPEATRQAIVAFVDRVVEEQKQQEQGSE